MSLRKTFSTFLLLGFVMAAAIPTMLAAQSTASPAPASPAPASAPPASAPPASAPAASVPSAAPESSDAPQAASVAVDDTATVADTTVDGEAKPPAPLFDKHGKKIKKKKVKLPKMTPVHITNGILTVDGFAGKAAMNYDIADLKFIYIWAPGIGTTVISNVAFPKGKEQANAFLETSLVVNVDGHRLEVSSDKEMLGKKPLSAWVYVDPDFNLSVKYPAMGYGTLTVPPYAWPGSKPTPARKKGIEPPPMPVSIRPVMLPTLAAKPGAAAPHPVTLPAPAAPAPAPEQPSQP